MFNQIIAALFLTEGTVGGIVAYVLYRKKRAKLERCQRLWGEVVRVEEKQGSEGGRTKHPVISYKAMSGETVTFTSNYGSSTWKIAAGDRVEIWADPSKPGDAEVVGLMTQWMLPLILGVGAVVSFIIAPIALFFFR